MGKTAHAGRAATSPARHDLAEIILDLRDAERKAAAARGPVARLEDEIAAEVAARARLSELDAAYAGRMAAWANGGTGKAPEPDLAARREAESAASAATLKAEAARGALTAIRADIAAADARVGDAKDRIKPAVAAVLREDGGWMAAEYWRRYAELEEIRRELAALDQVLLTDFPITHTPTGRTIVTWISPEKLAAQESLHAIDTACTGLAGVQDFMRLWRERVGELGG